MSSEMGTCLSQGPGKGIVLAQCPWVPSYVLPAGPNLLFNLVASCSGLGVQRGPGPWACPLKSQ